MVHGQIMSVTLMNILKYLRQPPALSLSISESFCIDPVLPDGFMFSEDNTVAW